jgi:large subunit ribosomal protein L22
VAATDTQTVITSRAEAKYVRLSARKARVVLDHIRGRTVPEARTILAFTPRAAAVDIEKVLRSAVANAEATKGLDGDELVVLAAYADEGPTLKRWRARARGRVNRIRKRTCHITLVVGETTSPGAPPKRRAAKPAAEKAPKPEAVTEETPAEETPAEEKPKTSTRRRTPAKKKEVSA